MKSLIIITALLSCSSIAFAQQKKPNKTKTPPPKIKPAPKVLLPPPIAKIPDMYKEQCYIYNSEETKDALINQTKTFVEYGWSGDNARIIIERKEYDPVKEKEAQEKGYSLVWNETAQYINGKYKIDKNILTIIPDKSDQFQSQKFKLIYKAKTKEVDYLQDDKNNKYKIGECPLPVISI